MDTVPTTLAMTTPVVVPVWVRGVLWSTVGVAVLMALTIGVMLLAGNNSKPAQLWRYFLLGCGGALLLQGGYLVAPFAIGRGWWMWSLVWMIPVVILALMALSTPVIGAMKWTRPDGASGWKTIASIGWLGAIGFALYLSPPILMWVYRPTGKVLP